MNKYEKVVFNMSKEITTMVSNSLLYKKKVIEVIENSISNYSIDTKYRIVLVVRRYFDGDIEYVRCIAEVYKDAELLDEVHISNKRIEYSRGIIKVFERCLASLKIQIKVYRTCKYWSISIKTVPPVY